MAKEKSQELVKEKPAIPVRAVSPFEEMDRMFESLFGRTWPRSWMQPFGMEHPGWPELAPPFQGRWPKADVIDRDNDILVRAELPGVKKEDIEVSMTDTTLTLRGCTSERVEEKKENYYRAEISRGEFTRTIALPCEVDSEKVAAKLDNGILEVTMPKLEKSKRKNVKVQ